VGEWSLGLIGDVSGAGTVVSLHKTQARAEAVADLHNERDSNQKWLG